MNATVKQLHRFDYQDDAKDAPLPCRCGFTAPGKIVEYYRFYHVLACMHCLTPLALVDHPVPLAA